MGFCGAVGIRQIRHIFSLCLLGGHFLQSDEGLCVGEVRRLGVIQQRDRAFDFLRRRAGIEAVQRATGQHSVLPTVPEGNHQGRNDGRADDGGQVEAQGGVPAGRPAGGRRAQVADVERQKAGPLDDQGHLIGQDHAGPGEEQGHHSEQVPRRALLAAHLRPLKAPMDGPEEGENGGAVADLDVLKDAQEGVVEGRVRGRLGEDPADGEGRCGGEEVGNGPEQAKDQRRAGDGRQDLFGCSVLAGRAGGGTERRRTNFGASRVSEQSVVGRGQLICAAGGDLRG